MVYCIFECLSENSQLHIFTSKKILIIPAFCLFLVSMFRCSARDLLPPCRGHRRGLQFNLQAVMRLPLIATVCYKNFLKIKGYLDLRAWLKSS